MQIVTMDETSKIGKISKQWTGLLREAFTDSDNFGIQFPMDLDVKMKAVMIGACFLIVSDQMVTMVTLYLPNQHFHHWRSLTSLGSEKRPESVSLGAAQPLTCVNLHCSVASQPELLECFSAPCWQDFMFFETTN